MNKLYDDFYTHFQIIPADNTDLLKAAYRIRYQVYCKENHFEDRNLFPDQMETDEYDSHSSHSLVHCKTTGEYAGLVRLVLPDPTNPNKPMPVEKYADLINYKTNLRLQTIPRDSLAEVSRFCISRKARQACFAKSLRFVGNQTSALDANSYNNLLQQYTTLGLFSGVIRMGEQNNITHILAVMQPALLRLLSHFGIHFHKIGPLIDYHGKRQPVIGVLDEMVQGIYEQRQDVWETITNYGEFSSASGEETQHTATGY